MPADDSGDLDTATLDAEALSNRLPAAGPALAERGRLLVEFVVEEEEATDELRSWITLCSPIGTDPVLDYVMLRRPIPSMYHAHVQDGGVQEAASAHLRAFEAVELRACLTRRFLREGPGLSPEQHQDKGVVHRPRRSSD